MKQSPRLSVGTDVIYIPRVQRLIDNNRLASILTAAEIKRSSPDHIAGRIALKEAAIKALGLSVDDWLLIVITEQEGKPAITLMDAHSEIESMSCSVSHDGDYALATVIVLYRQP